MLKRISSVIMICSLCFSLSGCVAAMYLTPMMDEQKSMEYSEVAEACGVDEAALTAIDQVRYEYNFEKANPEKTVELFLNVKITKNGRTYKIKSYSDYLDVARDLSFESKDNIAEALHQLNGLQNRDDLSISINFFSLEEVMNKLNFSQDQKELANGIYATSQSMAESLTAGGVGNISNYDLAEFGNRVFVHPSPDARVVTSEFGWRTHPVLGYRKFHTGVDLAANGGSMGLPVLAVYGGTVQTASYVGSGGNTITIVHQMPNGKVVKTGYLHLSEIKVNQGDTVTRGQVIGNIGSTGTSTGAHLHFMVYVNGELTNPVNILNQ